MYTQKHDASRQRAPADCVASQLEHTSRPCATLPGSAAAAHARGTSHHGPDGHAV